MNEQQISIRLSHYNKSNIYSVHQVTGRYSYFVISLPKVTYLPQTTMVKSVIITGANRGLGLEFVRQYLKLDSPPQIIVATCRDPDKATVICSVN